MGECINTLWYTHTMEYYPATKGNKVSIHAKIKAWMKVENITLNKRNQSQKTT